MHLFVFLLFIVVDLQKKNCCLNHSSVKNSLNSAFLSDFEGLRLFLLVFYINYMIYMDFIIIF